MFLTLLLFFIPTLQASTTPYILSHDELIDPRAIAKINEIGTEVETKTGVKIYLFVKENYGIDDSLTMKEKFEKIKIYENQLLHNLNTPYVLITMSLDQTHLNLFTSPELDSIIDKNEILNDYIIPLLASKDKNKLFSKVSAALLNGYAQIGDEIAASKNIKLESSIGSGGKTFGTIWKVFMYFIIVTGLVAYTIAVLKSKKR
ncbi:MAG: hypothetical protein WCY75_03090 [Sulfurimonadaceae bacterium]|nr:hypothetical protein [Arcobacteraceae bacterium]